MQMKKISAVAAIAVLALATFASLAITGTNQASDQTHIVARQDFRVNPALKPPEIAGRPFWLMLPNGRLRLRSDTNPPPAGPVSSELIKFAAETEPMVRDAAIWYQAISLTSATDRLVVDGARLLELEAPNPNVPFVLPVRGTRPQFKHLDDFKIINRKAYQQWKKQNPNFLGFAAGDEFDADYSSYLWSSATQNVARLKAAGASEVAITRMQEIMKDAVKDRDQALVGLRRCYDGTRRYYFDDPDALIFLHSVYGVDHYPLEWGAAMVILETTNQGPYRHQQAMFYARGAAHQYGKPWEWYIAQFYEGYTEDGKVAHDFPYCLTTNTARFKINETDGRGPTCGTSVSLTRRDFYLGYLTGASFVQPETYPYSFWQYKDQNPKAYELSPYGKAMKDVMEFSQKHPDRGVSYAPVALLVPYNHAQPCFGGRPWQFFPITRADTMIDAFMYTLVPYFKDTKKGVEGCLSNSEYGDIYDVILPNQPSGPVALEVLQNYPVAVMLGGFDIDKALAKRLMKYVKKGGTLVINARQINDRLPADFLGAKRTGKVCVAEGRVRTADGQTSATLPEPYDYDQIELQDAKPIWIDEHGGILACANDYGRGRVVLTTADYMVARKGLSIWEKQADMAPYVKDMNGKQMSLVQLLMRQIVKEVLPVEVTGDVEYGLNRVSDGWWVYLINNKGVTKFASTAEKLDPTAAAVVAINMRSLAVAKVQELRAGDELTWDRVKNTVSVNVGPGDIKVVKITVSENDKAKIELEGNRR